ncbi:MAG: helix-turn-helix transcriptional regulator [Symploca sp. SIO2E9]|nr:helix-turn-helix transcriptional regulator [Symploca sp. SIO2E9]
MNHTNSQGQRKTSALKKDDKNKDENEKETQLSNLEEDILTAIHGQELYGLEIMRAIEEASGGLRQIKAGSLYPTLKRLEKKTLVESRWGEDQEQGEGARRRYYRLTPKGNTSLQWVNDYKKKLKEWKPMNSSSEQREKDDLNSRENKKITKLMKNGAKNIS